jgi:hypothetical protein
MFAYREALSGYYDRHGVEKHRVEDFGYQSETIGENLLKQNTEFSLLGVICYWITF